VLRLEPVIMDLERQGNILIIGHQAILRCIYAYFMNYNQEDLPYIKIPLHTVIELTPKAYGCDEKRYKVDIEAVDTHRPKPNKAQNSSKKKISKQDLSNGTAANGNAALLGASGEIVNDIGTPILPISPQLWPSNSTKHKRTSSQLQQEVSALALE
jgi:6-phosphofructo-2-kinase/fructose-2,6-biphosphatase 2